MPGQSSQITPMGDKEPEEPREFSWTRAVGASEGSPLQDASLPDLTAVAQAGVSVDPDADVKKTKLQIKIDRLRKTAQLLGSADLPKLETKIEGVKKNAQGWDPGGISLLVCLGSALVGAIGTIGSLTHSTSFLMAVKGIALSLSVPAVVIGGLVLIVGVSASIAANMAALKHLENTDEDLAKTYEIWEEVRDNAHEDAQEQNYTHAEEERLFKSMLTAKSKALELQAQKLEQGQETGKVTPARSGQQARSVD